MGSDWEEVPLGEIFNVKHGFAFKGEYFTDTPTKELLVTPGNFTTSGGFKNVKPKFYNGPVPEEYVLNKDHIVVTMTDLSKQSDTLGFAANIPDDGNIWLHNQRVGLLEFNEKKQSYPPFFNYLLREHEYRSWIIGSATGTTVKHTSPSRIHSYICKLPPLPEQKAIAHILGSLDDKIELNRQINKTLESMAQALFKSWFVDFDPVIDNALAQGNAIPDVFAKRAEQRRNTKQRKTGGVDSHLFPSEFEYTEEMGWIPKGFSIKESGSLFDVRDGTHDSPKKSKEGKYLITSRHITGGTIDFSNAYLISEEDYEDVNRRSKVDSYDILLTMIGTVGVPLIVLEEEVDFAIKNIGLFKTGANKKYSIFFYLYLNSIYMKQFLESRLAGTTQKYLTLKVLRTLPVITSSDHVLDLFENIVSPMFLKIHENNKQILNLEKLRDTLLPKLLSGELRIPDAEKLIAEAQA